jgi:hypothetical protein
MYVETFHYHTTYHYQRLTRTLVVLEHINDRVQNIQDGFAEFNTSKPVSQRRKVLIDYGMLIFLKQTKKSWKPFWLIWISPLVGWQLSYQIFTTPWKASFPRPTTQETFLTCSVSERLQVFEWLSSVKYMTHHRIKFKVLLPGSGQWLFEKQEFLEWRKSSVSSILWLHGIRELLPA